MQPVGLDPLVSLRISHAASTCITIAVVRSNLRCCQNGPMECHGIGAIKQLWAMDVKIFKQFKL